MARNNQRQSKNNNPEGRNQYSGGFADLAREEMVSLVRQAVLSLPAHFREVIVLCHLQEMNYAEAAEVVSCPVGTVRSRLARARTLLVGKLRALKRPALGETVVKAGRAI